MWKSIKRILTISCIFSVMILSSSYSMAKENKERVTIRITANTVGPDIKETKKQIKEYMNLHPNVKVEVAEMPNSSSDILAFYLQLAEAKSGEVDIFKVDNVWLGDLAPNLISLNKYGFDKLTKDMFPELVRNDTVDGKLMAMPWYTNIAVLHYRKDLLEKYKLPVPKTWIELTKTAYIIQEKIKAGGNNDFVGFVWQGEAYEGLTCNALEWICSNSGGEIVNNKKQVTINNPNAIHALEMASAWVGSISPQGVLSMDEETSRAVFQAGNALFMRNWPYAYLLGEEKDSSVKGKIDFCVLPAGNGGKSADTVGGWSLAVNKYSKHPEIAADVVKFFTSEKQQKYRAMLKAGQPPTIKSLYLDKDVLKINPYFEKLYTIFPAAVNRPSTVLAPNYNRVSEMFYKTVYSVLTKKTDAESAVFNLANKISGITGFPIIKAE